LIVSPILPLGITQQTELSPCDRVEKGIAPTIIFLGRADTPVPFENAEHLTRLMKEAGNESVLVPFKGNNHDCFNGSFFR
jgi:dipeptidyl aminopeptidase/acylaminoacyl peptidase